MSSSRRKLISFMRAKDAFLVKRYNIMKNSYFNKKDAEELNKWDPTVIADVWYAIKRNIENRFQNLCSGTCPWCIALLRSCNACNYGIRHGQCPDLSSSYSKIIAAIQGKIGKEGIYISTRTYRKMIRKIEGK